MDHRQKHLAACLLATAALLSMAPIQGAWAQIAPPLGTASSFGALGGAGVTCTSPIPVLPAITVIGDVGSLLGAGSVTGFPPPSPNLCSLSGTVQLVATGAIADLNTAYAAIDLLNPTACDAAHTLSGDLKDTVIRPFLSPGVYCITGVGTLTGQLTLAGPSTGIWIFKAASSITPIGGSVVMANGGNACNVYWRTVGLVSLDSGTKFVGTILAGSAITFTGVGSSLAGRALAQTDVTMTGASISACNGGATQPPPPSCDKDYKHHKNCSHDKQHKHHKAHCDGEHDGHDNDGHDNHENDNDGHDDDGHDNDDQDHHFWK